MTSNDVIPSAVFKAAESASLNQQETDKDSTSLSSVVDSEEIASPIPTSCSEQRERTKLNMLVSAADCANKVADKILCEEAAKDQWREFFIIFLSVLLGISLLFIGYLILHKELGVSESLIISLLIYVVANVFSLLFFMVKYITSNKYMYMFKITYHKILDFIIQDK